ncbi:TolC family outer membrane protein [Ruegeria sp. R14_0]|uniref:TolC family outer membrane protein n=1 Tax=Ruegeria sp. R14_0 TaxID=2821100 RepID=UPI001AD9D59A|nr:TolC family outer membrane protein [Ruegeria sp. R14_0]MBO9444983.1 TolC family outer membrane protein [Ruegeria sp. R14_0]
MRQLLRACVIGCLSLAVQSKSIEALTLEDAILFVLETNPEITAAEANKQAIEFELQQARSFWAPRFEIDAFAGGSINDGNTTPDLSSAQSWIGGYELGIRMSQLLFDGKETRSEIERQAYRIDAAALRVLERSEVLSLEAVRLYADVLRAQSLVQLARENRDYHVEVLKRIQRAFDSGVVGIGDLQQAEERLILAEDTIISFELDLEDISNLFIVVVGVEAEGLSTVPDIRRALPSDLDAALQIARRTNPTIRFLQADVGSAEALSRRTDANAFPKLFLEADGRVGEDVGGYEGDVADARIGLVLRYQFQGTSKRAARQEEVRRVSESRARLLAQTRRVENEVRQSYSIYRSAQRRTKTITAQVQIAQKLRDTYEQEFTVGQRSLLDVLNTQNALFQAEANLVNAKSAENYVRYRILASIGVLLKSLNIEPPEDSNVYARDELNVQPLRPKGDEQRLDARAFKDWRKSLD